MGQGVFVYRKAADGDLTRCQTVKVVGKDTLINGVAQVRGQHDFARSGEVTKLPGKASFTGPLGPFAYLSAIQDSEIEVWTKETVKDDDGANVTVYYAQRKKAPT